MPKTSSSSSCHPLVEEHPGPPARSQTASAGREIALFRAWRDGSGSAGTVLFRLLRVRLLRYFWGVSRDIAEDLAQETLAAFFACNGRLRSEDALHCYVYRIAARTLGRELRRRDRQAELDELAMVPETFDSIDVDHLDLVRVLRTSRSKFAATVVDYYIGGRCAKELAADHCVPESTIRSRLRSGLGQLRRELAAS